MRTTLIAIIAGLVLASTPAAAKGKKNPTWSRAHQTEYRTLKRQVRDQHRALKRTRRQRKLNPVEKTRLSALGTARNHFSEAAIQKTLGHGTTALAGGMLVAEGASFFTGNSGGARLGLVSTASLGLSMFPGYSMYLGSHRSRARGIAEARRAGVPVSSRLRASARRTLLQEARAKRDLAEEMSRPPLDGAARLTKMADGLR